MTVTPFGISTFVMLSLFSKRPLFMSRKTPSSISCLHLKLLRKKHKNMIITIPVIVIAYILAFLFPLTTAILPSTLALSKIHKFNSI